VLRGRRRQHALSEAVETMMCSGGEAVEGVLRRGRRALGVGGVEDLKRVSGENLLSVEWAVRTHDIYIGARCVTRIH
jgi:hypothetical protein